MKTRKKHAKPNEEFDLFAHSNERVSMLNQKLPSLIIIIQNTNIQITINKLTVLTASILKYRMKTDLLCQKLLIYCNLF